MTFLRFVFVFLLLAGAARAAEKSPIDVTADSLEVEHDRGYARFTGNVKAVQSDLTLTADRLEIFYTGEGETVMPGVEAAISRVVAEGHVEMTRQRDTVRGDRAEYDMAQKSITITGDVVSTRNNSVLKGDKLTYDIRTGHVQLHGGASSGRVQAQFVPEPKQEKKK